MTDQFVVPGFVGDDYVDSNPLAFQVVTWKSGAGHIYYDGYLIYDRLEGEEDDLFNALAALGQQLGKRGFIEFKEDLNREGEME